MEGLVLAAGRGSRLGIKTNEKPKCLVPIMHRSILDWQLDAFHSCGITDISVVRGYKGNKIQGSFNFFENENWMHSNMVSSLRCASPLLVKSICIVTYSDIICHPAHIAKLKEAVGDIVVSYDSDWFDLWKMRFEDPLDDAETFKQSNGLVIEVGKRPTSLVEVKGQFMGLLKITPNGWNKIQNYLCSRSNLEINNMDMTGLLMSLINAGISVNACEISGRWVEIDNVTDIEIYEKAIAQQVFWKHDWRFN